MRRREISPEFWTDERVLELSDAAKLLFIGLWQLADREGRLEDKPRSIGLKVRPWSPMDVGPVLEELVKQRLVCRYEVADQRLLFIPHFSKHQRVHPKEMRSKLPPPDKSAFSVDAVKSSEVPRPAAERLESKAGVPEIPSGSSGSSGSSGPSVSSAPPPRQHLAVVYEKPDKDIEVWTAEDFFSWAQFKRQEAGLMGEKNRPRDLSSWFSAALMELGGDVSVLQEAFYRFGEDEFWQGKTPALPFAGFISQWDRFVPRGGGARAQS